MKRTSVTSTRIISMGWANNILEVEFKGGSLYQYSPISQTKAKEIQENISPGRALQPIIDNKLIKCEKVTPESL